MIFEEKADASKPQQLTTKQSTWLKATTEETYAFFSICGELSL